MIPVRKSKTKAIRVPDCSSFEWQVWRSVQMQAAARLCSALWSSARSSHMPGQSALTCKSSLSACAIQVCPQLCPSHAGPYLLHRYFISLLPLVCLSAAPLPSRVTLVAERFFFPPVISALRLTWLKQGTVQNITDLKGVHVGYQIIFHFWSGRAFTSSSCRTWCSKMHSNLCRCFGNWDLPALKATQFSMLTNRVQLLLSHLWTNALSVVAKSYQHG